MSASGPKRLNLFDATMLVMGGIIGVGIFFTPQKVALLVPDTGPYFTMWILGGVAALAGAMTFAELAGTFPRAGGWYVFLREAFGSLPAFLFAWIVLFVISTGATSVVLDFAAGQIGTLVWGAGAIPGWAPKTISVTLVVAITGIALAGVKSGALFQNFCMVAKLLAIGALAFAGLALFVPEPVPVAVPVPDAPRIASGMMQAALPVLFSYGGWQLVCYIAPQVENPVRNLPLSILLGVAGVIVVYLAINLAYVRVLGLPTIAERPDFASAMALRVFGSSGGKILVLAMAISSMGIVTALVLATPGLYVAMAEEGLFVRAIGRPHPRTGAPVLALLIQLAMILGYVAWGNAGVLTDAVVFAEWIFHALCGLALLRVRAKLPDLPRPFRSFAYPLFPALYALLATSVVVGSLATTKAVTTGIGLGVLAVGLVVYLPWHRLATRGR